MVKSFKPNGAAALIGSIPLKDHDKAMDLVFKYAPEIPCWVQLPYYKHERMIPQFLPSMPGLCVKDDTHYIDTDKASEEMVEFYQDYLDITENGKEIDGTRFALTYDIARGFFTMIKKARKNLGKMKAVKGQVTGPVTLNMGVTDQNGKNIFFNDQLKDAAVKMLAVKAVFQARKLAEFGLPVIIFIDEPALAGFGSSEMISISRSEIIACLNEIIDAIHLAGGLAGIHVCSNTDWSLIIKTRVDIINFDAYSYFDKFVIYKDQVRSFIKSGRIIAWGIVPTQSAEDIQMETVKSLTDKWKGQAEQIEELGFDIKTILSQTIITPSCGTGSLTIDQALKVLQLTRDTAKVIKEEINDR